MHIVLAAASFNLALGAQARATASGKQLYAAPTSLDSLPIQPDMALRTRASPFPVLTPIAYDFATDSQNPSNTMASLSAELCDLRLSTQQFNVTKMPNGAVEVTNEGYCTRVYGGSSTAGTSLVSHDCGAPPDGAVYDQYNLLPTSTGTTFQYLGNTNLCVSLVGTELQTRSCVDSSKSNEFEIVESPVLHVAFEDAHMQVPGTDLCWSIVGDKLELVECAVGDTMQIFTAVAAESGSSIKQASDSGSCVTVSHTEEGNVVEMGSCSSLKGQAFLPATDSAGASMALQVAGSNMCVGATGNSNALITS
ncbi:hypothetical protein HDU98_010315 [Podochytrium sp. JEL0797]|nr:hypothetical protein HDU98_010315 [Podochytrium sp. JEL0797]